MPRSLPVFLVLALSLLRSTSHAKKFLCFSELRAAAAMDLVVPETTRGRRNLTVAETLGLINCRDEFGSRKPLEGARITGFSEMTNIAAFFIKTLTFLGAKVRWCVSNILSAQDQLATANAGDSCTFFTWNGHSREEYWWCIDRALDWGPSGGPDLIIDYVSYGTLLILEGVKAEEIYAATGLLPDPSPTDNAELHKVIRNGLITNPRRYRNLTQRLVGVCLGSTDCVDKQEQANGTLLFPVFDISNALTNVKFNYLFGCRYALLDGLKRATDMTISGKRAVVCGFEFDGAASEGCSIALKNAGANVVVCAANNTHDLRARLKGFPDIIETLDPVVPLADIFLTNLNSKINVFNHIKEMKNNAVIFITDPILDPEIGNVYAEQYFSGMTRIIMDPQTDRWVSPDTNSSVFILRNKGYPSFKTSWSNTVLVVAILNLWSLRGTGVYENNVYELADHLEDMASSLHLAKLTKCLQK